MSNINSSLLDKAIVFAINAHKNVERRGKGFPYVVHPLEAMSIVASMTSDQSLLAAACLHDVIEDTDITYEDIKNEFGERIADLVLSESDVIVPNKNASDSWVERKQAAIDRLAKASREVQMVALGDKLSNMRALYRDYKMIGDELWNRFHVTDPKLHAWHYQGLKDALKNLEDTDAYKEFSQLVDVTFSGYEDFRFDIDNNEVVIYGMVTSEEVIKIKEKLNKETSYEFNFKNVYEVNFSGIRALLTLKEEGYHFVINEVSAKNMHRFDTCGASRVISVLEKEKEYHKFDTLEQSGEGYTALTYWSKDGDMMVKIYAPFIDIKEVEKEKRYSKEAMLLGIPTPLSGDIIEVNGKLGLTFERIHNKVSFARALANNPDSYDELAKDFAIISKKLHSTPCNKDVFLSAKINLASYVDEFAGLNAKEKEAIKDFILNTEDKDTCLHGDFHFGNAIITDRGEKLFIDMGDFSYGNPLFDLGVLWFMSHANSEERSMDMFHTNNANLLKFYQSFVKYYFDGKLSEEEADKLLKPYAALTVLFFAHKSHHYEEWMMGVLRGWLVYRER